MDTPTPSYERPRPPYARTASRSSTSTTSTRMTSQSASNSTTQIVSPQLTTSHSTHRFHHASCAKPTTPRATPRLSREASIESTRQTAVSSFLQERLQKERKAESEKLASMSRSTFDNPSSTDLRASHNSPTKNSESERRPQSSASSEKRGIGVKDMEQVISGLHKQNFDLKLELYHRRERQTALEERVEALESEKGNFEEINAKLTQEMEKRDKAIEEAVAMIVTLEAKLEQFAKERSMVRHIESEGQYTHFNPYEQLTPRAKASFDDQRLARMPSFLSDKSENTENLRNVYLGVKSSMVSLPQVAEGPGDADTPASPSMSVLSESSFVSVYGRKTPEVDEPLSLDGVDSLPRQASGIRRPKTSLAKPAQVRTARSNSMSLNGRQFEAITNVIEQSSPLQRIERSYTKEERPQSREQSARAPVTTQSPTTRRRDEKREALRKVTTDAPGGVRLHDHALPPTPDTISTSTLRRFQNSNDTLPKQELRNQPSLGALSDISAHDEKPSGVRLEPEPTKTKAKDFGETFERPLIQRPRSAGETTVSHRRGNDWDSDSDSDTRSLESSLDIWMRESAKPDRTGRVSPDLFGFPSAAKGGWAMDAMFGPSAYGSATVDPERLLEMIPNPPAVFSSSVAPPAPHRRSSLHAQTGSNSTKTGRVQKSKSPTRRKGRRNSDDPQIRAVMKQATPTSEKKNHYPPIVGHQGRNPLTKLFRRSLGGSTESTPVETDFADIPRSQTAMGVPSWINRDDDRDSATPPPIMRNPRQSRGPLELETGEEAVVPTTAAEPVQPAQEGISPRAASAMGNRRKWLPGFGRNSVKNKG